MGWVFRLTFTCLDPLCCSSTPGPTKVLFVKGLSEDTTDESLREAFQGAVSSRVVTDRETGASKWYVTGGLFAAASSSRNLPSSTNGGSDF
jgi:hypothetical protein